MDENLSVAGAISCGAFFRIPLFLFSTNGVYVEEDDFGLVLSIFSY